MKLKTHTTVILGLMSLWASQACKQIHLAAINQYACIDDNRLSNDLCELYNQGHIVGFSVAMANGNGPLYTKGFGYADIKTGDSYTENTIQNIASISKTLIGVALLKAQELGKLHLDDPINNYLPFKIVNPNFPEEKITIRHLSNHTSGIKDVVRYELNGYILKDKKNPASKRNINFRSPNKMLPMEVFFERLLSDQGKWYKKNNFYDTKAGTKFKYSNIGAALAAFVLEKATETTFVDFTEEHIFKPLGMKNTGWSFDAIDLMDHSTLYNKRQKELALYSLITYPDGGLRTSAINMGKYISELIKGYNSNGTLLSIKSYSELFKSNLSNTHFEERDTDNPFNDEYDMGVFIGLSPKEYIGHTGSDPGVASMMFFNKETNVGYYLIVNTDLKEPGIQELFAIWNTLLAYSEKLI
ncbi:MAG: CubicO group peptidase (beta-lactamase class C family) [Arcticibacterium sp.]|jgi:CubicO group peptidase (beta-lactamase class C family)